MRNVKRYFLSTLALGVLACPIIEVAQAATKPVSMLSSRYKKKKPVRKLSAKSGRKYAQKRKVKIIKLASKKVKAKKHVKKKMKMKNKNQMSYKKKNKSSKRYI